MPAPLHRASRRRAARTKPGPCQVWRLGVHSPQIAIRCARSYRHSLGAKGPTMAVILYLERDETRLPKPGRGYTESLLQTSRSKETAFSIPTLPTPPRTADVTMVMMKRLRPAGRHGWHGNLSYKCAGYKTVPAGRELAWTLRKDWWRTGAGGSRHPSFSSSAERELTHPALQRYRPAHTPRTAAAPARSHTPHCSGTDPLTHPALQRHRPAHTPRTAAAPARSHRDPALQRHRPPHTPRTAAAPARSHTPHCSGTGPLTHPALQRHRPAHTVTPHCSGTGRLTHPALQRHRPAHTPRRGTGPLTHRTAAHTLRKIMMPWYF
ncbi:hypothetical protein Bbelb_099810 [Branchiostoma belcheri]|nr:hypothetical protein Bbelb_099810 [Branchiostoma belcheri]